MLACGVVLPQDTHFLVVKIAEFKATFIDILFLLLIEFDPQVVPDGGLTHLVGEIVVDDVWIWFDLQSGYSLFFI